ncbi:hypothetical protein V8G54_023096 [Vigna mungo]|uniref:Uncharacterized protein n=1 Tax=Vigna mungo TaxID=3915 RepID=A0AAQ3N4F2_VIGMU
MVGCEEKEHENSELLITRMSLCKEYTIIHASPSIGLSTYIYKSSRTPHQHDIQMLHKLFLLHLQSSSKVLVKFRLHSLSAIVLVGLGVEVKLPYGQLSSLTFPIFVSPLLHRI